MYQSFTRKLEWAQAYSDLGWNVFPCHTIEDNGDCTCGKPNCTDNGKHPLTPRGFHDATRDPETLARYFGENYDVANIALSAGAVSGFWVLDCDYKPDKGINGIAELDRLQKEHGRIPQTVTAETGGSGRHYFFRMPSDGLGIPKSENRIANGIDVRGDLSYAILPPSRHRSGNEYRWLDGQSPWQGAFIEAPQWLVELARGSTATEVVTKAPQAALESSPAFAEGERQTTLTTASTASPIVSGTSLGSLTIEAATDTVERATRYADTVSPAISGSGGMTHTFCLCCYLAETFPELSEDDTLQALEGWNSRCKPPWKEKDLRRKIRDAREKVRQGDGLDIQTHTPSSSVPVSVSAASVSDDDADDWPVMDSDAYYGFAGDFVRHVEPHTEADPVAILMTFLTSFGNAVGRNPYYSVGGDRHHGNLFVAVVGQSSRARKGTSAACVRSLFSGIETGQRLSGLSTGEGLINAVRDPGFTESGGVFTTTKGVTDKRCLITESEFARLLKVMGRKDNTLSAIVRDAWDGHTLRVMTRKDPLTSTGAHVSIVAHITRDELAKTLTDTDAANGFGNRFLWCLVRRPKKLPLAGELPGLDSLRQRLQAFLDCAETIGAVTWSEAARAEYGTFYSELPEDRRGLFDAITSRAEAQVIRLALIYALLDGSSVIDVPHVRAAVAVWNYCDDSARILFGKSEDYGLETKVLAIVRDRPGITRTDLRNAISKSLTADELTAAVNPLCRRGRIVREERPTNGRTAECYFPASGKKGQKGNKPPEDDSETLIAPSCPGGSEAKAETGEPFLPSCLLARDVEDVTPASISEVLDWRNRTGANFVCGEGGGVWVSKETNLTPALRAGLRAHAETLRVFLPSAETPDTVTPSSETTTVSKGVTVHVEDVALLQELEDMLPTYS